MATAHGRYPLVGGPHFLEHPSPMSPNFPRNLLGRSLLAGLSIQAAIDGVSALQVSSSAVVLEKGGRVGHWSY